MTTNIKNCNITMHTEAVEAAESLANAMEEQAIANKTNSEAMYQLALSLRPTDACAIKIVQAPKDSLQEESKESYDSCVTEEDPELKD